MLRLVIIWSAMGALTSAVPAAVIAQEPDLRPQAARIGAQSFRAGSEIWVVRDERAPPFRAEPIEAEPLPAPLTLAQKSDLVRGLGKIMPNMGPWQVTPGEPKVQDRVWFSFRDVSSLVTNTNPANTLGHASSYAIFNPPFANHGVWLEFVPPAPGRYLVDCRVQKLLTQYRYRVTASPSGVEQTFTATDHLLLVYDAVQGGYQSFRIQAEGASPPAWQFYSCEVTPLGP